MQNRKIFIIDDSQLIRERLTDKLEKLQGIGTISHAADKSSALTTLQQETPDIVILDIQLPDGSGIDLLAKIKKENSQIIVIVLTNFPYSIIRRRCLELGADYFLDKSTELEKLFDIFATIS